MLQTETSAICNTWWLKATFQEPGENAAASAIGGAWNVGTRWFIGDRDWNICWGQHQPFSFQFGTVWILLDFILEVKGYQVLELEATSVLGDTLAPSHVYIYINIYICTYFNNMRIINPNIISDDYPILILLIYYLWTGIVFPISPYDYPNLT